jgi:hypothetical protein
VLLAGQPLTSGGHSGNSRAGSPSERCPIAADGLAAIQSAAAEPPSGMALIGKSSA